MPLPWGQGWGIMGGMGLIKSEFYRKRESAVFGGVCNGLATYFGSTPRTMRLLFVVTFFFLNGVSLPIYIVLWAIIPADSPRPTQKGRWMLWAFWTFGVVLSCLAITGVLAAELPWQISMGMTLITIGGVLLSTPKPVREVSVPQYAPGQIITSERTGEIDA